MTKLAGGDCT